MFIKLSPLRSLLALSLILSLLLFKPAPMYILDEIDAALDLHHTQNIGQVRDFELLVVSHLVDAKGPFHAQSVHHCVLERSHVQPRQRVVSCFFCGWCLHRDTHQGNKSQGEPSHPCKITYQRKHLG